MFAFATFAQDPMPFVYLNQYYSYEKIDDTSFKINDTIYSFNMLVGIKTAEGIEISFNNLKLFSPEKIQIEVLDRNHKLIKTFKISPDIAELKTEIILKSKVPEYICISSRNDFTVKKLCKKIVNLPSAADQNIRFSANGVSLSDTGKIILNDKNNDLIFKVENSDYFFELITGNKNIIPNRIYKFQKSDTFQVDFVDINNPSKYNFKQKIKLDDANFAIPIDSLITTLQDIAFIDPDIFNKSVDYEFKDWKMRKYNKFGIEPIGIFAQLITQSSPLYARVTSDLSKGFKVYLTQYPSNNLEYYYWGKITLLLLRNDVNNNPINNKSPSLISLAGGGRYYVSPDFHYDLNLALEEVFYAEQNNSAINIVKVFTPKMSLMANYILIEIQKWRLHFSAGFGVIGPSLIPSGATKFALETILGSQLSYKVRGGRFYYGADFNSYDTSNSTYKYQYQSLEHKIGFYYLF